MSTMKIELKDGRLAYEPGDEIAGSVSWAFDKAPRAVELRLFWFTRGKGTAEAGVAETVRFDQAGREESRAFRLQLPEAPLSFSGRLISLIWALELVAEPSKEVARVEIVVAPDGEELRLESLPPPEAKKRWFRLGAK